MGLRRSRSPRPGARGGATLVVLLLLAPLAACEDEVGDTDRAASPAASTTSASPSAAGSSADGPAPARAPAEATAGPSGSATDQAGDPSLPGKVRGRRVLAGGGFASAVPGSDAPDRRVDIGPQFTISDDVDIEEVERLVKAVERIARQTADQPLATGGDLAAAVGTFSYRWFADGTVAPDPGWVAANIVTGSVPVLGNVTCHRVMLPQLRGALSEVVARGLAAEIHPEEFGGCYVPRFIGRDPKQGLSLHSWGIAVDLNVAGNQRGVAGEIDATVVSIFKKWGFAWGGDWSWTDPMHFELERLVRARR